MILKDNNFKNKYILDESSTNAEFQEVIKSYDKIRCIICNREMSKLFRTGFWGQSIVTINNKIPDKVFWINGVY